MNATKCEVDSSSNFGDATKFSSKEENESLNSSIYHMETGLTFKN